MARRQLLTATVLTALLPILFITGCTPQITPQDDTRSCATLFDVFDRQVERHKTGDAATERVTGFSYLRSDRFLAHRMRQADSNEEQRYLAQQMRQRDLDSRYRELLRLPHEVQQQLALWAPDSTILALKATLSRCSAQLMQEDFQNEEVYQRLKKAVAIKDDYHGWRRAVGLYPLFVLPVSWLADNAHEEIQHSVATFDESMLKPETTLVYRPNSRQPLAVKAIRAMLTASRDNIAGLHQLDDDDRQRLADSFAPILRQVRQSDSDRIGTMIALGQDDDTPLFHVDTDQATVYYYFSETLLQNTPALQINYVFWYPGRYNGASSWIERGHLDGITLRYTLNCQGEVVMVDLINNCGCYHGMVPDPQFFDLTTLKQADKKEQILQPLPATAERQRRLFTFSPRHLLLNAAVDIPVAGEEHSYQLLPYEQLEQLPTEQGAVTSLFDPQGIVPGTRRVEAGLLFSMGIQSVGSMRQRGHQPITLIGREHFDDPELFDTIFNYRQPPPTQEHCSGSQSSGVTRQVNTIKALSQPAAKRDHSAG
jgi:hypothetical protein